MGVRQDIAIVGMGCAFPGALNPAQYWDIINTGNCLARTPPGTRWPQDSKKYCASQLAPDRLLSDRACFVDPLPEFTTPQLPGFNLQGLDPLFQLLLHAGVQAWDDAVTAGLNRDRCGVLLGQIVLPTPSLSAWSDELLAKATLAAWGQDQGQNQDRIEQTTFNPLNRHVAGLPAGLLAAVLELGGGASCLDAACASSLYALKLALDELRDGRRDAMLVGGLSCPDSLYTQMGFSHLHALSPSGCCRPFSRDADGLLVGEGAGVVVLKRLEDALESKDHIYATIAGIGLSNDIGGNLMHPDSEGQLRAMHQAYAQACWQPEDVDLIECHGTGTVTGDRVELASLEQLWAHADQRDLRGCVIGSVKSNIGHLLTAAGIAGLIKVLLAMQAQKLPAMANVDNPLPVLQQQDYPFRVLTQTEPWSTRGPDIPRRACVSAFGFGGINAHVLLQEWSPDDNTRGPSPTRQHAQTTTNEAEPIAIVGLAGCFGPWAGPHQLTARLLGDPQAQQAPGAGRSLGLGAEGNSKGYCLDAVHIDGLRFRIPPRELKQLLPQQALMLQLAADALDDAKITTAQGAHASSAVYVGIELDMNTCNFHWRWQIEELLDRWEKTGVIDAAAKADTAFITSLKAAVTAHLNADKTMGALGGIVASRIARWLGAGAGSFTVSCEQASAIKALEIAMRSLRRKEINLAVVGGVDLTADPRALQAEQVLQRDAPFCEGAGAVVLKRRSDAVRDGDRIYCLLRGVAQTGARHIDGHTDRELYRRCLEETLRDANLTTAHPGMVELAGLQHQHTTAQDLLATVAALPADHGDPPAIPSVSSSGLGNSGAASGMAALLRVAMCLHYRVLPALSAPGNGNESKAVTATDRLQQHQYWLRNRAQGQRQALLSVDSLLGGNAQVLAQAVESNAQPPVLNSSILLCVHGSHKQSLSEALNRCSKHVQQHSDLKPADIADRWHQLNDPAPGALTVSVVANTTAEIDRALDKAQGCVEAGERSNSAGVYYEPEPLAGEAQAVAFVFPGSGNHYHGMNRQLSAPAAAVLDESDARNQYLLDQFAGGAFWHESAPDVQDHRALLCAQIASSTFVHDIFRFLGIRAGAMIGYSLGETASLFASGCWPNRDAMLSRIRDTDLFTHQLGSGLAAVRKLWGLRDDEPVDWRMAMIQAPAKRVRAALEGAYANARIYLLIINTENECVVGGDGGQLKKFATELGVILHPLTGITSVHCEVVESVAEQYRNLHLQQTRSVTGIDHYSCHLGRRYNVTRDSAADSILGMALAPFDFCKLINQAYADGIRVFLETGPGDACSRMIDDILQDRPHLACSASHSRGQEFTILLHAVASVAAQGVSIDCTNWQQHHEVPDNRQPIKQLLTLPLQLQTWQPPPRPRRDERQRTQTGLPPNIAAADLRKSVSEWPHPMVQGMSAMLESRHQAHKSYLQLQQSIEQSLSLALQITPSQQHDDSRLARQLEHSAPSTDATPPLFNREACLRFAVGDIADVFGPQFADIDAYPTRVRLPDEPLMLVDQITSIEGSAGTLGPAEIVTEHRVHANAWYLDSGRIPTCIAVEAGQADLFLSAWLGIDRVTGGNAVYRLLDADITFHGPLPEAGKRIVYKIQIVRFFKLGTTHLFQFQFDASIDGQPLLSMRNGSAGFFTPQELAAGQGIIKVNTASALLPKTHKNTHSDWLAPPLQSGEHYSDSKLDALRTGDLEACFGAQFAQLPHLQPQTLPAGRMRLVHRVLDISAPSEHRPGKITGEADIHPQDWFLTCHFIDDQVMPGTLMYECCLHTLRIYLLRMGWVGDRGQISYQPVPGQCGKLKCRGQVIATTRKVQYQISVWETGYLQDGTPYALADALMLADGQPIVEMHNMSLRLSGLVRQDVEDYWGGIARATQNWQGKPAFDHESILAYAQGRPSDGFGDRYLIFDEDRVLARLPRPPYLFLDQIEQIEQCEAWQLAAGGKIRSSYQVDPSDWYFAENRQAKAPLAILLEIALQPCGWLAAYLGSALNSASDLSFRNLDGQGTLHRALHKTTGRISATTQINKVSQSGGMIIQSYSVALHDKQGLLYSCETVFGFFTKAALAQQIGIRDAQWYAVENLTTKNPEQLPYPVKAPFPDAGLRMLDHLSVLSLTGGRHGLGWVEGNAKVDAGAWYFQAHFYQDPVIPGSLGLESMVQLLKVYALERWAHLKNHPTPEDLFQCPAPDIEMRWTYRGQVIPDNDRVSVQIHVSKVDSAHLQLLADGYLAVDGRIIYSVENLSLGMRGSI